MINSYLTDTIDIVAIAKDDWGVETRSATSGVLARVEDVNVLVKNNRGEEVIASIHLIVDYDETLSYDYKIQIKTRNGEAYPLSNKDFAIQKMIKAAGFDFSHWEVWL